MKNSCLKICVIGGGASGLLFSYLAKFYLLQTAKVTIFEKNNKVGKKILASGNGKCNLSNANLGLGLYNSSFATEVFSKISDKAVLDTFLELGILTKTDEKGRIYPLSLSANSVLDALYNANLKLGNEIICDHEVKDINYQNGLFFIDDQAYDICIMACGSMAGSKNNTIIGKSLTKFGHKWVSDRPGLCMVETYEDTKSLNGIKVKANVSVNDHKFDGEVLFKNNGLSGIAIFEASRYVNSGDIIHLDLLSDYSIEKINDLIDNIDMFKHTFPKMVSLDLLKRSNGDLKLAIKEAKDYKFKVKRIGDYENAQIMMGGIDTSDMLPTLESKLIPNLYILGEVLDVDGTTGGYNLHFAWASAIASSQDLRKKYSHESSNN